MKTVRRLPILLALVLLAAGCGDDDVGGPPDTTSSTTSSTTSTSSTTTSSSTTTTTTTSTTSTSTTSTTVPTPVCDSDAMLDAVDAAVELARLAPGDGWSTDTVASSFAERTATGAEFAERLAFDCGLTATETVGDDERLVIAAWTGPRFGYVIQSTGGPSTPYRLDATVTVIIDSTRGEYLDGDEQALWAGTFDSGETFVVGHADYSLGPVAKDWVAGPRVPFDEEINLDSERHAIAVLEAAGMRNIGIAQPPMFGSEEGYVLFISPAGQIIVADVAPTDWFDPMVPRYYHGETRFETISSAEVRITDPNEDDNLGFTPAAEYAWACDDFVWILEPPFNGDADEVRTNVQSIVDTEECSSES